MPREVAASTNSPTSPLRRSSPHGSSHRSMRNRAPPTTEPIPGEDTHDLNIPANWAVEMEARAQAGIDEEERKEFESKRTKTLATEHYSRSSRCGRRCGICFALWLQLICVASAIASCQFFPNWYVVTLTNYTDANRVLLNASTGFPMSMNGGYNTSITKRSFNPFYACWDSHCESLPFSALGRQKGNEWYSTNQSIDYGVSLGSAGVDGSNATSSGPCMHSAAEVSEWMTVLQCLCGAVAFFSFIATLLLLVVHCRPTRFCTATASALFSLLACGAGGLAGWWFYDFFIRGWLWCDIAYCEAMQPNASLCETQLDYGLFAFLGIVPLCLLSAIISTFLCCAVRRNRRRLHRTFMDDERELKNNQEQRSTAREEERVFEQKLRQSVRDEGTEIRRIAQLLDVERERLERYRESSAERGDRGGVYRSGQREEEEPFSLLSTTVPGANQGQGKAPPAHPVLVFAGVDDWVMDTAEGLFYSPSLECYCDPDRPSLALFDPSTDLWFDA